MAAKLAAHELRESARKVLKMKPLPSLPYNTEMQVIQRSWKRGVWESLTYGEGIYKVPVLRLLSRLGGADRRWPSVHNE